MELTKNFKELGKGDAGLAGGKGASLGEMTQSGIPVPSGFVVLADTFEQFLHATDLMQEIDAILDTVDHKQIHTIESASEKIQSLIKNAQTPEDIKSAILKDFDELNTEFVAVRSSATAEDGQDHAWAGQLDSYLNITKEHLLEKVQHCWASLFTPRAIFYRFEKGLDTTKISVAVVVQKMVNSEVSGIAFSVHPVTEDRNQLIIEAGFGLGEAIVSGQITPDSYVVEKEPRNILDVNVSEQARGLFRKEGGDNEWREIGEQGKAQVLTQIQINELSNIILTIENHYGFPCDIEWAFEAEQFYIVQSRPITTLSKIDVSQDSDPTYINGKEWKLTVTRNMSFWHNILNTLGGAINTIDFGVKVPYYGMFFTQDGIRTSIFIDPVTFPAYVTACMDAFSTKEKIEEIKSKYNRFIKDTFDALEVASTNLSTDTWKKFRDEYQKLTAGLAVTTHVGRVGTENLINLLKKNGYPESEIPLIVGCITYPSERTPIFNSQVDLLKIAEVAQNNPNTDVQEPLQQWLEKYRHIPVNYTEDPWSIDDVQKQFSSMMQKDAKVELEKILSNYERKISERDVLLKKINNEDIEMMAYAMSEVTILNEFRKSAFCKLSLDFRKSMSHIVSLGGSENWRDCFFLLPEETLKLLGGERLDVKKIVFERRISGAYINDNVELVLLNDKELTGLEKYIDSTHSSTNNTEKDETQTTITGFSANKGVVRGIAKIILSSKDFDKLNTGEILVTTMTSVDFVPVMDRASAFVTNEGGITCHASIVAREMNKPCIIGTKNATQVIEDGDMVEVDANNGIVKIIK